jgi:hypothetical protein
MHEGGEAQPIVRCSKCSARSCFPHLVPWHERLTCEEYDEMLRNPDGFQSALDREDEAQRELELRQQEGKTLARQRKEVEEGRQRQRYDEEQERARVKQQKNDQRMKAQAEESRKIEDTKRKTNE